MTSNKGKQFLLRVTAGHVEKGQGHKESCMQCPAAQALGEVFPVLGVVRTRQYDRCTGRLQVGGTGGKWIDFNSATLEKQIRKFDSIGEFTPGVYLCEVV